MWIWEPSDESSGGSLEIQEAETIFLVNLAAGVPFTVGVTLPATLNQDTQFFLNGHLLTLDDVTRVSATQISLTTKLKTNNRVKVRYYVH